jgi:hypothetical protein
LRLGAWDAHSSQLRCLNLVFAARYSFHLTHGQISLLLRSPSTSPSVLSKLACNILNTPACANYRLPITAVLREPRYTDTDPKLRVILLLSYQVGQGPLLDRPTRPGFSVGVLGALLACLCTLRYTLSMAQGICMDFASQQLRQEGLSST